MPVPLPWGTILKIGLPILALIGIVWFIADWGGDRREERIMDRIEESQRAWETRVDQLESNLNEEINDIGVNLEREINDIEVTNRTVIQPTLEREIRNDQNLNNPAFVFPERVFGILNSARAESGCPASAPNCPITSVPTSESVGR